MKPLSKAQRESLVAKVVTSGFFSKEDAAAFPDAELEVAVDLIEKSGSILDPNTGFMDSDDFTEVMGRKPVGRLDQGGKHTIDELKNATSFVHREAVNQAPRFLLDLNSAALGAGMELAREFLPHAVKRLHLAMDKVTRFPEVPSDLLRAYVISTSTTVEGVRAKTLQLLENMAGLGYHIYNPGGNPDIEDRHADSVASYKDIAVKFVKDAPGDSDPVVKEVLVLQPNMLRQKKLLDGFYGVIREANSRLLGETSPDQQATMTRIKDKFDRRVKQLSAKAYLEDNPTAPMSLTALRAFMIDARDCAEAMRENSTFIQKELSNVQLEDSLKERTIQVCSELIGTRFDIVSELFELDELIGSHATDQTITSRVESILDYIRNDIAQMHELVMAVHATSDQNPAYGLASTLITESAVNILNSFNRAKDAADLLVAVFPRTDCPPSRPQEPMPRTQLEDFPPATKFFVKGADVPVAVLPDGSASSWYGGTPTHWDKAHLVYATRESQQRFVEVPYAEFARLVDESLAKTMTEAERKLAEAEVETLLAWIRARREPTDPMDYFFARAGANGLPDPEAD